MSRAEMWRAQVTRSGREVRYGSMSEFLAAPPPEGLGLNQGLLDEMQSVLDQLRHLLVDQR